MNFSIPPWRMQMCRRISEIKKSVVRKNGLVEASQCGVVVQLTQFVPPIALLLTDRGPGIDYSREPCSLPERVLGNHVDISFSTIEVPSYYSLEGRDFFVLCLSLCRVRFESVWFLRTNGNFISSARNKAWMALFAEQKKNTTFTS